MLNKIDYLNDKMPKNPQKGTFWKKLKHYINVNYKNDNNDNVYYLLNNMIDNYVRYQLECSNNNVKLDYNRLCRYYRTIYYKLLSKQQIAKVLQAAFVYYIDYNWYCYWFNLMPFWFEKELSLKYLTINKYDVSFKIFFKEFGGPTAEGQELKLNVDWHDGFFNCGGGNYNEFAKYIKSYIK